MFHVNKEGPSRTCVLNVNKNFLVSFINWNTCIREVVAFCFFLIFDVTIKLNERTIFIERNLVIITIVD